MCLISQVSDVAHGPLVYMECYCNVLIQYRFIGIVKLNITRRNEILEIEDLSKICAKCRIERP